ncbi:MAG: hypothetical protein JO112_12290, partial [Planctomycetes bacterium]|nr:hypothetical protein [Planctomycetota bacterium]
MSSVDIPELPSWRDRARQALATVARKISLAGVPALVAALGVLAMAIFVATDSKEACANWYAAEADRRAQEGDYEVALICNQWLIRNRGQTPELRFAEAELYRARGDRVAALAAY